MVRIITDSASDFEPQEFEALKVDYASLYVYLGLLISSIKLLFVSHIILINETFSPMDLSQPANSKKDFESFPHSLNLNPKIRLICCSVRICPYSSSIFSFNNFFDSL